MSVLYVIACGSPVARRVGTLVDLAQRDGWDVCVVTSRDGRKFVDVPALAAQSGHPVRSEYKNPGDPDVLPDADAMVVAPATVNTMTKWSAGIADTLALGLLVEGIGKGLPIVALPFTNSAMAAHPAFGEAVARLRSWGVTVLYGDDVVRFGPPGQGRGQPGGPALALVLKALPDPDPVTGGARERSGPPAHPVASAVMATEVTVGDVVAAVERRYPPATAAEWDRVGLVVGDPAAPVRRVLCAVDCVAETVAEAVARRRRPDGGAPPAAAARRAQRRHDDVQGLAGAPAHPGRHRAARRPHQRRRRRSRASPTRSPPASDLLDVGPLVRRGQPGPGGPAGRGR